MAFQRTLDKTDSEDDTAYRNNTDDSVFLAKKMKDTSTESTQKPTTKGKKSKNTKTDEKETNEHDTKNSTVDNQNNAKISKLKDFLEEISKQHKMGKSEKSCRSTELCYFSANNPKPFEYTDFVAFIQCGVSRRLDEMDSSSSDSGTDTKEKEHGGYLSTSFDSLLSPYKHTQ